MSKPRIMLYWRKDGSFWWMAGEGVEVVCVDDNVPGDRVYVKQGDFSPEDFDRRVDEAIAGTFNPLA